MSPNCNENSGVEFYVKNNNYGNNFTINAEQEGIIETEFEIYYADKSNGYSDQLNKISLSSDGICGSCFEIHTQQKINIEII